MGDLLLYRSHEPLAINYAGTRHYHRGDMVDYLSPSSAYRWLEQVRLHLGDGDPGPIALTHHRLRSMRAYRRSVESLLALASGLEPPSLRSEESAALLTTVASKPQFQVSAHNTYTRYTGDPYLQLLARIAASMGAILNQSEHPNRVRQCSYQHCILYFVPRSPRQTWCSQGCGNRARVARAQSKVPPESKRHNATPIVPETLLH